MEKFVGIIGAGTMGSGIALAAAQSGCSVSIYDNNETVLAAAMERLRSGLVERVSKGRLSQKEYAETLARLKPTTAFRSLGLCDVVVEAIAEKLDVKREVFKAMSDITAEQTLLASNTSALSIGAIAAGCKFPERILGMHFFNPAPVMKLVELVSGINTSDLTLVRAKEFVNGLGKESVVCRDTPAFIVNRIARNFYGESLRIAGEGTATPAEIDAIMREVGKFKMGPFELMDFIGIDVNYTVTQDVYNAYFQEPRFRPHQMQRTLFESGRLGRKSGQGFYDYTGGKASPKIPVGAGQVAAAKAVFEQSEKTFFLNKDAVFARVLAMIINEAMFAVQEDIASEPDIDLAMKLGTNYPAGPIEWGRAIGFEKIHGVLRALHAEFQDERYKAAPLLKIYA